jgi:hypothetical protein
MNTKLLFAFLLACPASLAAQNFGLSAGTTAEQVLQMWSRGEAQGAGPVS